MVDRPADGIGLDAFENAAEVRTARDSRTGFIAFRGPGRPRDTFPGRLAGSEGRR